MAFVLGYDRTDLDSDNDDGKVENSRKRKPRHRTENTGFPLPSIKNMDKLDTATLIRLGWMEPLGYRALSKITHINPATLRNHFWASQLKLTSPLFADINYYFTNGISTSGKRLKRVFELKRFTENNCDYKVPNVKLLWHGTKKANVGSILTNGFQLPNHNGMFGAGVYFADRASKSLGYCDDGSGVLFLCAVNLGKVYRSMSAMNNVTRPPRGYDSVQGCGNNVPDRRDKVYHRGAVIPCGKTVGINGGGVLVHNEFIVYDLSKIAILFLIEYA